MDEIAKLIEVKSSLQKYHFKILHFVCVLFSIFVYLINADLKATENEQIQEESL